jgi:hypothetical protein
MLLVVLPTLFFHGCFAGPEIEIPVQPVLKLELGEVKELAPVHVIHRGKKMEADMEASPNSLECYYCHSGEVSKHRKDVPAMSVCKGCHTGRIAPDLSCENCHLGQKKIFSGAKGAGVEIIKSPMADLDCEDCHDSENELRAPSGVCEDCHDEAYIDKTTRLQEKYTDKIAGIKSHYEKIGSYVKIAGGKRKTLIDIDEFEIGEYYYKYALLDRSKGIHNNEFVMRLLGEAEKTISMLSTQYNEEVRKLIQKARADDSNIRRKAVKEIEAIGGKRALLPFLNSTSSGLRMEAQSALTNLKNAQDMLLRKRRNYLTY